MKLFIITLITIRLFFWILFPTIGMSINAELAFLPVAIGITAVALLYKTRIVPSRNLLLFVLISLISFVHSGMQATSTVYLLSQSIYIILFALIVKHVKYRNVESIVNWVVVLCFMIAVKSIIEILFAHPPEGRAVSLLGWPTATASVLLLVIPLVVIRAIELGFYHWLILAVLMFGFISTKSVFPSIALIVAVCFALLKNINKKDLVLCLTSIFVVGLVAVLHGHLMDSINVRISYMFEGIGKIFQHPFIGIGPALFGVGGVSPTVYVHNSFIQIWAETGVIGFAAICMLIYNLFMMKPDEDLTMQGVYWGLMAFSIDNLNNFTLLRYSTSIYFWVLLGCYCVMYEYKISKNFK